MNWMRFVPLALLWFPATALADVSPGGGCRCDLVSASMAPSMVLVAIALVAFSRR